jgi:hypothetical protein
VVRSERSGKAAPVHCCRAVLTHTLSLSLSTHLRQITGEEVQGGEK